MRGGSGTRGDLSTKWASKPIPVGRSSREVYSMVEGWNVAVVEAYDTTALILELGAKHGRYSHWHISDPSITIILPYYCYARSKNGEGEVHFRDVYADLGRYSYSSYLDPLVSRNSESFNAIKSTTFLNKTSRIDVPTPKRVEISSKY